jgi:hypothetical protein
MTFQVIVITSLIFSVISLILSCVAVSIYVGLQNSTHKVQYIPIDPAQAESAPSLDKQLQKEWNDFEEDEI